MMTNKLFSSVAIAALVAGGAQAQIAITRDGGTSGNLPLRVLTESGDNVGTTALVASQFQPADEADQLTGELVVNTTYGATAPFASAPVDARVLVTISLENATFTTAAAGTADNSGVAAVNERCKVDSNPVAGGGIGSSSVSFLGGTSAGDLLSECTGAGPVFTFGDIRRTASDAPIGVTFTYTTVDNVGKAVASPITKSSSLTLAGTGSAWNVGSSAGRFTTGGELLASADGILTKGTTKLGSVTAGFQSTAQPGNSTVAGDKVNVVQGGVTTGAAISATTLLGAGNKVVLTFPAGAAGLSAFTLTGATCGAPVTTTTPAQTVTCTLGAEATKDLSGTQITATADGKTVTPEQTISAVLTPVAATNYVVPSISTSSLATIKHDDGLRNGTLANSSFRWTAFGASSTESQFRISGMTQEQTDSIQQVRIFVAQGGNGVSAPPTTPGYYVLTNTGDVNTGFVVRGRTINFNSKGLGAAAGLAADATGNANITGIDLQFTEAGMGAVSLSGNARIDRQLASRNPTSVVAVPAN